MCVCVCVHLSLRFVCGGLPPSICHITVVHAFSVVGCWGRVAPARVHVSCGLVGSRRFVCFVRGARRCLLHWFVAVGFLFSRRLSLNRCVSGFGVPFPTAVCSSPRTFRYGRGAFVRRRFCGLRRLRWPRLLRRLWGSIAAVPPGRWFSPRGFPNSGATGFLCVVVCVVPVLRPCRHAICVFHNVGLHALLLVFV